MTEKKKDIASKNSNSDELVVEQLFTKASNHIDNARKKIQNSIDYEMLNAYWCIGRDIVEEEQKGQQRAEYGKKILKKLSIRLQAHYKRGFSVDTLEKARKFYVIFQEVAIDEKSATASRKLVKPIFFPNLSWSHYVALIKEKREAARLYYATEASKNNWAIRELTRQMGTLLYDRLIKSKDQDKVIASAYEHQLINTPSDAIKDPYVLEFIDAPEPHDLNENQLESSLITNLQSFLLELGKGFAFVARQKRLSLENDHFYADLVFYHTILKCYVIIDLKTGKLSHSDLGQLQLYVNYFDREVKQENDNPTIGLVLCTKKNDAVVKYLFPEENNRIFASTYQFHLPTIEELEKELKKEVKLLRQEHVCDESSIMEK